MMKRFTEKELLEGSGLAETRHIMGLPALTEGASLIEATDDLPCGQGDDGLLWALKAKLAGLGGLEFKKAQSIFIDVLEGLGVSVKAVVRKPQSGGRYAESPEFDNIRLCAALRSDISNKKTPEDPKSPKGSATSPAVVWKCGKLAGTVTYCLIADPSPAWYSSIDLTDPDDHVPASVTVLLADFA